MERKIHVKGNNKIIILFGLRGRKGFCCSLGRHLGHYYRGCTLALRVLLGSDGEGDQHQLLALGSSFLLGWVFRHRWQLSRLKGCLLCWLLFFLYSTSLLSLLGGNSRRQRGIARSVLVKLRSFGSNLGLGVGGTHYLEGWGIEDIFCPP